MKSTSLNGHQLVIEGQKHNLFHYLTIVIIRSVKLLVFGPVGLYLMAVSWAISSEAINPYLPSSLIHNINQYSSLLPYLSQILNFTNNYLLFWCQNITDWRFIVIGIPLGSIGFIILATVIFDLLYALFDRHFQITHCPFCREPIKIKKSLSRKKMTK